MDPHTLVDDLVAVAREAARIDLRPFEERDRQAVREDLVPRVRSLVDQGLEVLELVLSIHEETEASPDSEKGRQMVKAPEDNRHENFYISIDRVLGAGDRSSHVADLAFMARMELRDNAAAFGSLGPEADRWRLLAQCDECLRGLRKAMSAVERAVADHAGFEARLDFVTELHLSRLIRAYYARLRREIRGDGPPTTETVHERLHSAAASIAKLIGRDFYGDLRVADRAELRALQARLRSWLRGEDDHDPESGLRLWQDVEGFTVLLAQINGRGELLEHDRILVSEVLKGLMGMRPSPDVLPQSMLQRLERLKGRTDRIDDLLAPPVTRATGPWLAELQRLDRSLRSASAGDGPAPFDDFLEAIDR